MNTNDNRQNAHNEIDRIFKELLPARSMAERPAQVALCHQMLNAMLTGSIALCDAGTGIGKTYAYLAAGTVYHRFRAASGLPARPILISTSSIALQTAARDEYLPLLSEVLSQAGMITAPLQAVIRKGKSHYVCEERLERRLGQLDLSRKNWRAGNALLTLRSELDMDDWSREAVTWATENDLLLGDAAGDLMLRSPLTREQFCVMLKWYHDHFIT